MSLSGVDGDVSHCGGDFADGGREALLEAVFGDEAEAFFLACG